MITPQAATLITAWPSPVSASSGLPSPLLGSKKIHPLMNFNQPNPINHQEPHHQQHSNMSSTSIQSTHFDLQTKISNHHQTSSSAPSDPPQLIHPKLSSISSIPSSSEPSSISDSRPLTLPLPKPKSNKRIKTPRACDSCRAKKIRCDLPDQHLTHDNISDSSTTHQHQAPVICAHCSLHQIECTWVLPITETRFKRKRPDASMLINNLGSQPTLPRADVSLHQSSSTYQPSPSQVFPQLYLSRSSNDNHQVSSNLNSNPNQFGNPSTSHSQHHTPISTSSHLPSHTPDSVHDSDLSINTKDDSRIYGATSMSYIIHSTASFPVEQVTDYDKRFLQSLESRETGEGYIRVIGSSSLDQDDEPISQVLGHTLPQDESHHPHLNPSSSLSSNTLETLTQSYFNSSARLFPLLRPEDLHSPLTTGQAKEAVSWSICCVAAMGHTIDPSIRRWLRAKVYRIYRSQDVLQSSDLATIIALLMASYSVEFEGAKVSKMAWTAVGTAVRMAQSLGLHRRSVLASFSTQHQSLRQRIWSCCIIADRWVSVMFGLPMSIDLADCDLIFPDHQSQIPGEGFDEIRAMVELSILLGKVAKLLYSPTGITHVTDEQVFAILAELDAWQARLPDGPLVPAHDWKVGHLRLYAVPVRFLLYRPFMRISFLGPHRLRFSFGEVELEQMKLETAKCIYWVEAHPTVLEGYAIGLYSLFMCCLLQFQCHARKKTTGSLELLERARAVLELIETPDCYVRGRACDVVRALCRVAGGARAGIPMGGQAAPTVPTLGVHPVPHCEPTHMNLTPNLETSWTSAGLDWDLWYDFLFKGGLTTNFESLPNHLEPPGLIKGSDDPEEKDDRMPTYGLF